MAHAHEIEWLRHTVGALALTDRTIISVSGDDALQWLQGQVSNQVESLGVDESVYAFVLTLKGRIAADVWVLRREGDEIWLDVPASEVDSLLERLDRYIIMEDVDLVHLPELRLLTAQGPRAVELLDGGWPSDRLGTGGGRLWVVSDVECKGALNQLTTRCQALSGGLVGEQAWAEAHVLLARPRFGVDFGDWTYPQESGLSSSAVSFTKGCYIGQETVTMLQSRGKAPKVLWRWSIEGSEAPPPKTAIEKDGTIVGEVTSAAPSDGSVAALGFLKRGHEASDPAGFRIGGAAARAVGPVDHDVDSRPVTG